ncbi:hypothetical protein A2U01_0031496, partial [Trifolium medium]|nr:hypothetical protein [Trifolium medium]
EVSSQQCQTGQRGPRTEALINTNGNNAQVNNETDIVGPNGNNGNGNGRRGRNSPEPHSSDNEDSRDYRHEDNRGMSPVLHLGRTPFTLRILESRVPRTLEKPPKLETYDGTKDPDEHVEHDLVERSNQM